MRHRGWLFGSILLLAAGAGIPATAVAAGAPIAVPARAPAPAPALNAFDSLIGRAKHAMMADPAAALSHATAAAGAARSLPDAAAAANAQATALWLQGEALTRLNQPERALRVLQQAHAIAARIAPRDKLMGDIVAARGWAEGSLGRAQDALRDFQAAHDLFRSIGDARNQAKALQNIGAIYADAGENARSLSYYSQVTEVYSGDPAITLAAYNNLGETLKKLGRFAEAELHYRRAAAAARTLGSPLLEARILTNLASAQVLNGELGAAERSARRALAISASGEAAGWRPYAWGVLAQIELKRGRVEDAAAFIARTFAGVDLRGTSLSYREFHQTAAEIYHRLGSDDLAFAHLQAFKRLDDDARALAASANAALMAARFDFANQNLKITQLKAGQLRRDALLAQSRARMHNVVLTLLLAAAGLVFGLLLVGFLSIRRSRNRVAAANADLSEANASLEKALKVKTEFLATTSHEIRTPLNGILGMTQVLLADGRLDDWLRDRVNVVHAAGETMKVLVDDILDIAKIESGNLVVERTSLDLRALLHEAEHLWRGRAEGKGLRLDLDVADCPRRIEGDPARLRQVLFNLMSNALKFTETGSVGLSAAAECCDGGEVLVVRVRDSGIGIAEDQQALVFDKFRQADGSITRRFGGTGLGLAICRSLAEAMGGAITVDSRLGEGALFTVTLPLHRAGEVIPLPSVAARNATAETLSEARVLVVEQNALTRRILSNMLAESVGGIEAVATPAEAAERLAAGAIDHVVADIASLASEDPAGLSRLEHLAGQTAEAGARMTLLYAIARTDQAAALVAARAEVQTIAKPIGAIALLAELRLLYPRAPADDEVVPRALAAASAG